MAIIQLSILNLRNIETLKISPGEYINLIIGPNGSGKTSILESIYLLGSQRSFRASDTKSLIKNSCDNYAVYGKVKFEKGGVSTPVGVMRNTTGQQVIKISGEKVKSAAKLAQLLPMQVIDPGSFKLLEGGPKARRQFIDWGVFHVEQSFHQDWCRLNRCLKQRNIALRHARIDTPTLKAWDRELVEYGDRITSSREAYIKNLEPLFNQTLSQLTTLPNVTLSFYPGWDRKVSLEEVLQRSLTKDKSRGYTQYGPQRADLKIRFLGQNASQMLSRGEQKIIVAALKIAQGKYFNLATGRKCIYLVDDLAAELDDAHKNSIFNLLSDLNSQIFITAVNMNTVDYDWLGSKVTMFHVKHGAITTEPLNTISLLE